MKVSHSRRDPAPVDAKNLCSRSFAAPVEACAVEACAVEACVVDVFVVAFFVVDFFVVDFSAVWCFSLLSYFHSCRGRRETKR